MRVGKSPGKKIEGGTQGEKGTQLSRCMYCALLH